MTSFDLDSENPESNFGSDLETLSLESFAQDGETGFSSSDHHCEAPSLTMNKTMAIGFSLGSLTQNNSEGNKQRDSFGRQKPKKKVTFSQETLAAYKARCHNDRQQNSQLRQLEHNNENCSNNNLQQAWQHRPNMMQQQPATAYEKMAPEHEKCFNNNSLDDEDVNLEEEDRALGSLTAQPQATTMSFIASRSPKHNNNSILGQDLKNKAAWGIMIDTGAAMSLAPVSFAPDIALSPLEGTFQLRSLDGKLVTAYGRKLVHLRGAQLSFDVSFVIADVVHVSLGIDAFVNNKLNIRSSNNEIHLVNIAGAKTKLTQQGHFLYLEAWSDKSGLSTCRGSSFQNHHESLLDDKDGTLQDAASEELVGNMVLDSGGATGCSFPSHNLRQHAKNTTSLGTALPTAKGAKQRNKKKKKPSATGASHHKLDENSSERKGQEVAAAQLRSLEKTRLMDELELAATKPDKQSLSKVDLHELSLRTLLILSLRFRWQITTTRATIACSEDALGQQLRNIGLDQNSINNNIFSGDELVILLCHHELLIVGTEQQQEDLFLELSAYIALDQTNKLDATTQVSFGNRTLRWNQSSNSIGMSLEETFCMELLQRYNLEDEEEKLCQDASGQDSALEASRQKLYQQTVGDLTLAAACRPDLCFEIHCLIQSFEAPTTKQEQQLHKVLRHLRETSHYSLSMSLHITTKIKEEKVQSLELLTLSNASWTSDSEATSAAYMTLWGAPLVASCKTCCAQNQGEAELQSVRLALGLACQTRMLLQQLGVDKLEHLVDIRLKTSSFHKELVKGRPIAMQLGLSRKNKHIELAIDKGQLYLSKVTPQKNLAHSMTHNASDEKMLAKPRVLKGAAETGALSTLLSPEMLAFVGSSSSLVGVVQEEPPAMANQLRQLALSQSVFESFSQSSFARQSLTLPSLSFDNPSLESTSLQSLNLSSLSFQKSDQESLTQPSFARQSLTEKSLSLDDASLQSNSFESLTDKSLSLTKSNSASLILHSCSLRTDNESSLTLQSLSFENESLKETEKETAHSFVTGGAKTNSLPQDSLQNELCQLELKEESGQSGAGTNSFTYNSFLVGILSLNRRLQTFLLISFQLTCAALFLVTSYVTESFQSFSEHLCKMSLDSMISQLDRISLSLNQSSLPIRQLDLSTSLSFHQPGSTTYRSQLQNKFQTEQLVQQQLSTATALATQLQQQQPQQKQLDANKLDANNILDSNQLQRNQLEAKKQNKQLQEQQLTSSQLRQLHLQQLQHQDQPFTKQLSKKPCFATTSFSKQELERLHLTRSTFQQDLHHEQLEHFQSAQLLADHLAGTSFDKPQQQQLAQPSFYPKIQKQNLAAFQSQLRPEQPKPAYSRLSLQQLTPSNLLENFQLPSSALLLAILAVIVLVDYDKSFQLTMQQLCLPKAQGGELPTAFPPACCTTCSLPAWILMSLSFTVVGLTLFSLASRRSRTRRTRALRTSASPKQPLQRRRAWRQRSSSTIASKPSPLSSRAAWRTRTFQTRTSSRTTLSHQACRMTTLQTSALRRTSFRTSSSTTSTSAFTTRARSLMSTALLSILLISFSFDKDIANNSLFHNELSANFSEELVEQEANIKAKSLQLTQLQQQIQDRELGQQEQKQTACNFFSFNPAASEQSVPASKPFVGSRA